MAIYTAEARGEKVAREISPGKLSVVETIREAGYRFIRVTKDQQGNYIGLAKFNIASLHITPTNEEYDPACYCFIDSEKYEVRVVDLEGRIHQPTNKALDEEFTHIGRSPQRSVFIRKINRI